MFVLLSLLIASVYSLYFDETDRMYVKSFYGKNFSVDESYPIMTKDSFYAKVNWKYPQPEHNASQVYPDKIWMALIHTVPSKMDHVNKTRETWCKKDHQKKFGYKCAFIMVKSTVEQSGKMDEIIRQNNTFGDIYFIDMPELKESWFTLQLKNINAYLMALDVFKGYNFYTRIDDQVMVTPDLLSDFLMSIEPKRTSIGVFLNHSPFRDPKHKYFDRLAVNIPKYFYFPLGFFSMFSRDIVEFMGTWEHYHCFAPSSLEDPGFGHWLYKFAIESKKKVRLYTPEKFGGNMYWDWQVYGDYMVFHDLKTKLNVSMIYQRRLDEGHFN
ncbi:beta-1,3-N-acetylglucosaminyltransferase, putative [Entamoeba invadens IP1]|uniref:Hexosyltransferase n=1 Tax=Entamoeba invadens IP1 TaxID=370355 RepID=A0A0A1UDS9_ENTIV|nr:beta-1,3-N-acetylglucosaminyltransferase, putative [Entamoeba invadens IP1]ELP94749.1 beta-1,3-N-acetylglucosaminyltransferase, putative [Entamoeba invadens IP1]|eukprot:XP_004261520.1 beta-1,3-N-acetylglucosaminyltransferase, putative [Entamoeba invadens IP1]